MDILKLLFITDMFVKISNPIALYRIVIQITKYLLKHIIIGAAMAVANAGPSSKSISLNMALLIRHTIIYTCKPMFTNARRSTHI